MKNFYFLTGLVVSVLFTSNFALSQNAKKSVSSDYYLILQEYFQETRIGQGSNPPFYYEIDRLACDKDLIVGIESCWVEANGTVTKLTDVSETGKIIAKLQDLDETEIYTKIRRVEGNIQRYRQLFEVKNIACEFFKTKDYVGKGLWANSSTYQCWREIR